MTRTIVFLLAFIVFAFGGLREAVARDKVLGVAPSEDKQLVRVAVNPTRRSGIALVQLFDSVTGRCVRTIYAGPTAGAADVTITKASGVPAGAYKLRYRQGIDVVFDKKIELAPETKQKLFNPTDVAILDKYVYLLDSGFAGLDDPENVPPQRVWKTTKNTTHEGRFSMLQSGYLYMINKEGQQTYVVAADLTPEDTKVANEYAEKKKKYDETHAAAIYRFTRDGKPDLTFGEQGRVLSQANVSALRALAVDDDGLIYMGSGGHSIMVLPADGGKPLRQIGGWDGDPLGPKCTPWSSSLALGRDNRVYLPNGYGNMKVYDRTKADFAGILGRIDLPSIVSVERAVAADREGRVYELGNSNRMYRFNDDGATFVNLQYMTDEADKLCGPTGPSASGNLVWVACHGPGFGPYWDSGGGGEIVLYWDDQDAKKFKIVERFGTPGTGDATGGAIQFLNPAVAVMSRDQTDLWVTEDGLQNREGPPGNARVRRFTIKAAYTEEMDVTIAPWP